MFSSIHASSFLTRSSGRLRHRSAISSKRSTKASRARRAPRSHHPGQQSRRAWLRAKLHRRPILRVGVAHRLLVGLGLGGERTLKALHGTAIRVGECSPLQRLSSPRLWTLSVRANASIEERRRCCRPMMTSAAAACCARVRSLSNPSRRVAIFVEQAGEEKFGRSLRQAVNVDLRHDAAGETALDRANVVLEPADHDLVELAGAHRHAAAEPLRVEKLEQGREAVRMAVMRRRREEQTVLKAGCDIAHGPGDLRVDGIARPACRSRVVGLVNDEHGARPEVAEPVTKARGVGLVDQKPVRDQEAGVGGPRVDRKAALATHRGDEAAIENDEAEAEARLELFLPLEQHRRRAGDDDRVERWRRSSSRAIRPASIVLPRPTSSAMNRLTRGRRSALRSGSSW